MAYKLYQTRAPAPASAKIQRACTQSVAEVVEKDFAESDCQSCVARGLGTGDLSTSSLEAHLTSIMCPATKMVTGALVSELHLRPAEETFVCKYVTVHRDGVHFVAGCVVTCDLTSVEVSTVHRSMH